jgi:hypothetical protein
MTSAPVLGQRALNRALLERQHLLTRATMPALSMIEHLVGTQAQSPLASYVGLWTRLTGFRETELAELMTSRQTVRATLMRGTIHLVSAADALTLRPLIEPTIAGTVRGQFGRALAGLDMDAVAKVVRELIEAEPRTRAQLREVLGQQWPDYDAESLSLAATYLVPTVQVTPRGVWGSSGPAALTTLESWLGRPLDPSPSIDAIVLRYLAAFGPASVMDAQAWSGLTRLREVFERLPGLRTYRSEAGVVLYDVESGALPSPEVPAAPRYLPEYDNILLSHADRTRVNPEGRRVPLPPGGGASMGTVLIDGVYAANWRLYRERDQAAVEVMPFHKLTSSEKTDLEAEGMRLVDFIASEYTQRYVQIHPSTED